MIDRLTQTSINEKSKREIEWEEIENLVIDYQARFKNNNKKAVQKSQIAAEALIERFEPLFNKYLRVIKKNEINLIDRETKSFVLSFVDKSTRELFPLNKKEVVCKFKSIINIYGTLSEHEILSDQHEIFMKVLKRYKQVGRSFCGYLYNVYYHEMSRLIKKYVSTFASLDYKELKEYESIDELLIDYYDKKEVLYLDWISGSECAPVFKALSITDRKILIAYYLENKSDKQIGENFGIHINTVNQKRHKALLKLLDAMPNNKELKIVRSRKVNSFSVQI